jgi:hypothetical protein
MHARGPPSVAGLASHLDQFVDPLRRCVTHACGCAARPAAALARARAPARGAPRAGAPDTAHSRAARIGAANMPLSLPLLPGGPLADVCAWLVVGILLRVATATAAALAGALLLRALCVRLMPLPPKHKARRAVYGSCRVLLVLLAAQAHTRGLRTLCAEAVASARPHARRLSLRAVGRT